MKNSELLLPLGKNNQNTCLQENPPPRFARHLLYWGGQEFLFASLKKITIIILNNKEKNPHLSKAKRSGVPMYRKNARKAGGFLPKNLLFLYLYYHQ